VKPDSKRRVAKHGRLAPADFGQGSRRLVKLRTFETGMEHPLDEGLHGLPKPGRELAYRKRLFHSRCLCKQLDSAGRLRWFFESARDFEITFRAAPGEAAIVEVAGIERMQRMYRRLEHRLIAGQRVIAPQGFGEFPDHR